MPFSRFLFESDSLTFEWGRLSVSCIAICALRIRVRKSAIGSVTGISYLSPQFPYASVPNSSTQGLTTPDQTYQLAFVMPGISPRRASSRKQIRQSWNFRKYPLGRPQRRQRVYARVENFGFLFCLAISDFLAIRISSK